jgi:hypothetical protein
MGSYWAEGDEIFRAIKICCRPSFGEEVSHWPYVVRFYSMLKIPSKCEQRYFVRPNS